MAKNALGFGSNDNGKWKKGIATFKFKGKKVRMSLEKENYIFLENLLPEYPEEIEEGFEYFVEFTLDDDDDVKEVTNIRPAKWMGLKMKCVDCTRQDGEPSPYTYTATFSGKEVEQTCFYLFYECIEGEYKGVRFPNRYMYKFKNDGNGQAMWDGNYDNPKATQLHRVVDHLSMLGAVSDPIEWPDDGNVLPELLARIVSAGVVVETAGGGKFATISEMMESKTTLPKGKVVEDVQAELEAEQDDSEDLDNEDW